MSVAILAATYAPERRGHALGLFASAIAVGRATGPTLGGFLLHLWGWPSVFVMNAAIGFLVSIAVIKIFQGSGERRREPFDYWGSISLLIGYPSLLIGFTSLANSGWELGGPVWWFALAGFGLSSFVMVELRSANPLIDLRILRRGSLSKALLSNLLSHAIYNPTTLCAPLFLKYVLHAAPLSIGVVLSLLPLMTAAASPFSGKLADRVHAGHVMTFGLGLILIGVFVYAMLGENSSFVAVGAALALIGLGIGCFTPANQKVAFASVSSQDYGVLSATLSSLGTAAGTLGTTLVVALMENHMAGRSQTNPSVFAAAQQFALTCLLPLGVLGVLIALKRARRARDN
jgi:MFS family permease